jgi:Transglycosylase SLT domain
MRLASRVQGTPCGIVVSAFSGGDDDAHSNPFDPIEALRHLAAYLRELLNQFGNLGLAATAYNTGPARVTGWPANHRPLPNETRNYVALVTGWTADARPCNWRSPGKLAPIVRNPFPGPPGQCTSIGTTCSPRATGTLVPPFVW